MEVLAKTIEIYQDPVGERPYSKWFASLKDKRTKGIIRARLNRVRLGNFGHCRSVGTGVSELKIDYGPGFRIYFGLDGDRLVILLFGGTKKTQNSDIDLAQSYWEDYKRRKEL